MISMKKGIRVSNLSEEFEITIHNIISNFTNILLRS